MQISLNHNHTSHFLNCYSLKYMKCAKKNQQTWPQNGNNSDTHVHHHTTQQNTFLSLCSKKDYKLSQKTNSKTYLLYLLVKMIPQTKMISAHTETVSCPSDCQGIKAWKDVNLAEQIGLKMAKSKWLEAQHALKRNSLRKDNPHIRILTHFTHSCVFLHTVIVKPRLPDCPHESI